MKKIFMIAALAALFSSVSLKAQTVTETTDSLVFVRAATMDESLKGVDVFTGLTVNQSQSIASAMRKKVESNKSKKLSGYRVRIYFGNSQNSRNASEEVLNRFNAAYPGFGAYRTYTSPYFKVTAGNFRTKSEAMQFLQSIRWEYPSAIVVKENIDFPTIDRKHSYTVDTVKVFRPVTTML